MYALLESSIKINIFPLIVRNTYYPNKFRGKDIPADVKTAWNTRQYNEVSSVINVALQIESKS